MENVYLTTRICLSRAILECMTDPIALWCPMIYYHYIYISYTIRMFIVWEEFNWINFDYCFMIDVK